MQTFEVILKDLPDYMQKKLHILIRCFNLSIFSTSHRVYSILLWALKTIEAVQRRMEINVDLAKLSCESEWSG